MPREGIQAAWCANWNSGAPGALSKPNQSPSELAKVARETASARTRCCPASSRGNEGQRQGAEEREEDDQR